MQYTINLKNILTIGVFTSFIGLFGGCKSGHLPPLATIYIPSTNGVITPAAGLDTPADGFIPGSGGGFIPGGGGFIPGGGGFIPGGGGFIPGGGGFIPGGGGFIPGDGGGFIPGDGGGIIIPITAFYAISGEDCNNKQINFELFLESDIFDFKLPAILGDDNSSLKFKVRSGDFQPYSRYLRRYPILTIAAPTATTMQINYTAVFPSVADCQEEYDNTLSGTFRYPLTQNGADDGYIQFQFSPALIVP